LIPALLALLAAGLAFVVLPRLFLARAQDRLAREKISREGERLKLMTRADLAAGRYRRVPGVLGLTDGGVAFEGLFGESVVVPAPAIGKIETGRRLSTGRLLLSREVLRITRTGGECAEFILTPASAYAWRSHLGLWAVRERQADADRVVPGR